MTRSKAFLAVTSVALALVGVAATKKHQATAIGYYAIGLGHCVNQTSSACTSTSGTQCTFTTGGTTYELGTYNNSGSCITPVFKDSD